jgi:hypothetical protein
MKKKLLLPAILLVVVLSTFTSCTKDTVAAPPSLLGFWQGYYNYSTTDYPTTTTEYGFSFLFRSDSTVRVFAAFDTANLANSLKGEGTYSVSHDTVTTTYTYYGGGTHSTLAVVNNGFAYLQGTWGTGSPSGGGLFVMYK